MIDSTGGLSLGGITFANRPGPEPANALPALESQGTAGQSGPSQDRAEKREPVFAAPAITLPGPKIDESTLAGPPPAFKVSLLELDRELQESLARINADMGFGAPEVQPIETETRSDASRSDRTEADTDAESDAPKRGDDDTGLARSALGSPDDAPKPMPEPAPRELPGADTPKAASVMMGQGAANAADTPQLEGEIA